MPVNEHFLARFVNHHWMYRFGQEFEKLGLRTGQEAERFEQFAV